MPLKQWPVNYTGVAPGGRRSEVPARFLHARGLSGVRAAAARGAARGVHGLGGLVRGVG